MKQRLLFLFAILAWASTALAGTAVPFGSKLFTYATHIKPNNVTAAQMDTATQNFYTNWRNAYLSAGCPAGQYRINYDGANQTVSEAHGYGMLVFALMAGYDANAKTYFDGMYQFYKAHPANGGANRLLAWKQNAACADIEGPDTASDGDLDVAQALLLADRQWGSCGAINYRSEANLMIAQIKQYDLNSTAKYVKLGSWATSGNYLNSTRSSDFMPDHYRSFQWSTGDAAWNGLIDYTYYIVTATAHSTTGLLPDFIANPLSTPIPAPPNFLEADTDGKYSWNACRDPWRLATDYLVSGDLRAKNAVQKMVTWAKTAPISGNPNNVRAGYELNGTALVAYGDAGFTTPFAAGAMVDAANQTFINTFWTNISGAGVQGYYGDSIKLLSMIVLSGNWWAPEAMPDPCALGTPTSTRTRTMAPSATPSPTVAVGTPTFTRTGTVPAATLTRTPTPTLTTAPAASCKVVMAYYTSWADPYVASSIPYSKLTHICHAFIWPNANGTLNIPAGFVEPALITNAHANGVKVLISLGGATGSGNFAGIANNAGYRATFVAAVKSFILTNGYDGVDFDWEFPVNATDRSNFTLLVQEIRNAFNAAPNAHPEWLITGAYSWTPYYAQWYDLAALTPLIDFFNVMTYDAHGPWSAHSGHNAPLGAAAGDTDSASMASVMDYYINTRGVPASKINFGLAFYGYNFPTETIHANCPTCGADTPSVAYKDIVGLIGNGWTRTWDASASSPYLRHDTQARTLSYDDPQSIQAKSNYALNTRNVAGVFMWDLSLDNLGGGNQPLLDAMRAPMPCLAQTATPTRTITVTRTATLTRTGTATSSPTRSVTPSITVSNTSVQSATPSITQTRTSSATQSNSPSPSSTSTVTVSVSPTPSRTATATPPDTLTATATLTNVPVGSTATVTPSVSPTHSHSPQNTATASSTAVNTATASATPSLPTASPTNTAALPSATSSATPSSTRTSTVSVPSATATRTGTAVAPVASATSSRTPSSTAVVTAQPTVSTGGPLVIEKALPVPNPNPTIFYVQLSGWADQIDLKIFSSANTLIASQTSGPHYPGWTLVYLPPAFLQASSGTYFYVLQAKRGQAVSKPVKGTLLVLR